MCVYKNQFEAVSMSTVSFVKVLSPDHVKEAIQNSLDLIEFGSSNCLRKVVIKPNMCYYWDFSTGYTTDPKFVGAIVEVIRDISPTSEISIVEADASAMKCRYAFKMLGYEKLAHEYSVNLVNLAEDKTENVQVSVGGHEFNLLLPNTIRDADLRINVPKPKFMDQTTITCALKNVFGCNPEPLKYKLHRHLDEAIVALNIVMKFNLNILDGLQVTGASPRRLNIVMASQDSVAFDAAASKLMGVNPQRVRHLKLAQKAGLGKMDYTTKGFDPQALKRLYPKKKIMTKFLTVGYKTAIKTGLFKIDLL